MAVSRDIDLTRHLDFNKDEVIAKSVKLPKEVKDTSYKRYNEYENTSFRSTTSLTTAPGLDDWGLGSFSTNFSSTSSDSFKPFSLVPTIKVEERVCWRKLYKDPNVFEPRYTADEWVEVFKNRNFPMGSREDRMKVFAEVLKDKYDPWKNRCERCGKKFNPNNCFSHFYGLCQDCNVILENQVYSVNL